ncbi:MAG: hypothetical protein ACXW3M_10925, partial [Rhodoplanes sp.]
MTAMYAAPGALAQHVETTTSAKDLQALAESIEDEGKRKELLATIRALIAAREGRAAEAREPLSERIVTYASEAVRAADEATGDLSS